MKACDITMKKLSRFMPRAMPRRLGRYVRTIYPTTLDLGRSMIAQTRSCGPYIATFTGLADIPEDERPAYIQQMDERIAANIQLLEEKSMNNIKDMAGVSVLSSGAC